MTTENVPQNLKYTATHEWVEVLEDNIAAIGITEHAQKLLGDIVFVELPEIGKEIQAKDDCGVIESVKSAADLYTPISGEIIAVNDKLDTSPELINQAPYKDGWIVKIKLANQAELNDLMSSDEYLKEVSGETV